MRKVKKDLWEYIMIYPSFDNRFFLTLILVGGILMIVSLFAFLYLKLFDNLTDQIAAWNLIIQSATLILGVFAAYYALRQLVETRLNGLDRLALEELQRKNYSRAIDKWKQAFFIQPDGGLFLNLCESLIFIEDYESFDKYIIFSQKKTFSKKGILPDISDQITLKYLISIRHLVVKNQGEAEKYLYELVSYVKKNGLGNFRWNFLDLETSSVYLNLTGECKQIAQNLISYLSNKMTTPTREDFESGKFAVTEIGPKF